MKDPIVFNLLDIEIPLSDIGLTISRGDVTVHAVWLRRPDRNNNIVEVNIIQDVDAREIAEKIQEMLTGGLA
jgi:alkyl hydroperoxide reductase subunit AhpC